MCKLGKKVRQTLTLLLAVSMLAGSVPVNTFAMENTIPTDSVVAVSEGKLEEGTTTETTIEKPAEEKKISDGVSENNMAVFGEEVTSETPIAKEESEVEVSEEDKIEETLVQEIFSGETVSENQFEDRDLVLWEEEEEAEEIDIEFALSDDEFASLIKIIHIDKNNKETEVEDYVVTTVAGEDFKFRLEIGEGCKVKNVKMGSMIIPVADGIYTIRPADSDCIDIEVVALEKYNVTFSYDTEQVKNLEVKMGKTDVILQDNVATGLWEDSVVSVNVTLRKWMKIVKVTAVTEDGKVTELKAKEGTLYELEGLKENCVIKVETSLDEKQCNTLDIVVMGHHNYVSVSHGDKMYKHGERLLCKNNSETISVYLDSHYVMNQVLLNDKKEDFSGTNTSYTIDFSENKNQTIIFYVTPKKSNEEKKIVFANKAANVTYSVNMSAPGKPDRIIVKKDVGKNHTYTVSANETVMEFTVTAKAGYEPQVTIPQEVLRNVTVGKNQWVYSLAVATLGNESNPTEIYIDEIPVVRRVEVAYDTNRMENLTAMVDGKRYVGEEGWDGEKKLNTRIFQFEHGTEIVLQVEAKKGFRLGTVKEVAEGKILSEVNPQKRKCTYTVKANKNKTVELLLESVYNERVYDAQGSKLVEITAEKNVYPVESGKNIRVNLCKGTDPQTVTTAVLKSGGVTLKDKVEIKDSENVCLKVPETEVGKTITLEVTCKDGGNVYTHSVNLKVLAKIKISSITNVTKGKLSQMADTVKEYKFTTNIAMEDGRLGVDIVTGVAEEDIITEDQREELNEKAKEDFEAEIEKGILRITVKTSEAGEKANIKIYDKLRSQEGEEEEEEIKYYLAGGTVLVTSTEPGFVKTKPTVALNRATNLNLVLNLGAKKIPEIENGAIWYKIEGTPKFDNETLEETKAMAIPFVEYVMCTGTSQTESIRVLGREDETIAEGDAKQKVTFDIKVSLVQTYDKNEPQNDGGFAFESKTITKKNLATKAPSYETNLGVKVMKPQVYSGQKDVIVAVPVFSKNTSFQKISCEAKEEGITVWVDEKNNIKASVEQGTEPGKYTVEVKAETVENMVASKKSFTIEVVQGICDIVLDAPEELYKGYKKEATLKVKVLYNENSETQPKTKKLKWSLLDADENELSEEHPMYEFVSVKNGVVTVAKDYIVSENSWENRFYVKAAANDYKREEELAARSKMIEITNQKIILGELVLVKETELDSGIYDVTARSGQKATIDKVNGSKLVVLKKGTPERECYTEEDFMLGVESKLQFTSDSDLLKINEDYTVKTKGVVPKVTISALMKDGSEVTTELKEFEITYAPANDLGIGVKFARTGLDLVETYAGGTTQFYGTLDEILQVKIQEKVQGNNVDVFGADYELKMKGAKIVKSNSLKGEYTLVASEDTIVLEVLNRTKNHKKTFTLKNMAFANAEVRESKVLSLTEKGTLKTGYFTEEQKIVYTLPKEAIGKYTHAKVTVDNLEYRQEKKKENYDYLIAASRGTIGEIQQVGSDGKIIISFKAVNEEEGYYIPEKDFTYKLNISLGTVTEEYEFKAQVKPSAVSVKTQKEKLVNAKIPNTLQIPLKESGKVDLTLNNKKVTISHMGTLMNKNSKGKSNDFTQYFTLECIETDEETYCYALKLKSGVNVKDIKKADLSGYISEYTYTDGVRSKTIYNAPVKVNLKELVNTYSLTKVTVLSGDMVDTNVVLKKGKTTVPAGYVYVPGSQKFEAEIADEGAIHLQSKEEAKLGATNKCTMYVLPEASFYGDEVEAVWSEMDGSDEALAKWDSVMKKYGIKLTTTVDIKNKKTATGKIVFDSAKLTQAFKAKNFVPEAEGSTEGVYTIVVPYKKTVDIEIEDIYNPSESSLVQVEKTPDENSITLTLSKEALREAYETDKKIYGKTVNVKVAAEFAEEAKKEVFTFKVTLPNKPIQLKDAIMKLKQVVWTNLRIEKKGLDEEELVTKNLPLIEEKVKKILSADCDIFAEINGEAILPTEESDGKLTYTIILTDSVTEEQKKVSVEIALGKFLIEPMELEESLQSAVDYWTENTVTNKTTLAEILSSIRGRVEIGSYKHLRLYAKEVQCISATVNNVGSISGIFCIVDITDSQKESLEIEFVFEIPKLLTFEEAVVAVEEAVEQMVVYNEELGNASKKEQKTELILNKAREVLKGQEYYVQIKQGSTLKGELAKGDVPGKATIELEVIYLTTERIFKDVTCELQVLETDK